MEKYYFGRLNVENSAKLTNEKPKNLACKRVKLVELLFSRQPPTFGIVYLLELATVKNAKSTSQQSNNNEYELVLESLELKGAENQAELAIRKRVKLENSQPIGEIVDFDVCKSLHLDFLASKSSSSSTQNYKPQCIFLCSNGNLFEASFVEDIKPIVCLSIGCDSLNFYQLPSNDSLLECKINYLNNDNEILDYYHTDDLNAEAANEISCQISILSQKCYYTFKLTRPQDGALELKSINRYTIKQSTIEKFKRFFTVTHKVVLIEMLDSSLKIIKESQCLMSFKPFEPLEVAINSINLEIIVIRSNSGTNEPTATIIVMQSTKLKAFSLQIDEDSLDTNSSASKTKIIEDPDQLLPPEPSFELDECWSIDLQDLDSIRSLEAESSSSGESLSAHQLVGGLCPFWSMNQSREFDWPKYLIVSYKYYLLIYSFEQKPTLPFSVVYDSSFLEVLPMSSTGEPMDASDVLSGLKQQSNTSSNSNNNNNNNSKTIEYVDTRCKPQLLHNFKLIGSQPSDLLFNTLFLAKKINLPQILHFPQLGLFIASSNHSNHLLAFKLTSAKVNLQKDNVYQQLVADSIIKSKLLLAEDIQQLESQISSLKKKVNTLELNSTALTAIDEQPTDQSSNSLDQLLHVELKRTHNIGVLYDLMFSLSSLVQVQEIVVTSTVQVDFLEPKSTGSYECIDNFQLVNNRQIDRPQSQSSKVFVSSEAEFLQTKQSLDKISTTKISDIDDESANKSWTSINLNDALYYYQDSSPSDKITLTLPVFIMDGQSGELSVYFVLQNSQNILNEEAQSSEILMQQSIGGVTKDDIDDPKKMMKFHKRSIQIKHLMSYELDETQTTLDQSKPTAGSCLIFEGKFEEGQIFSWLNDYLLLLPVTKNSKQFNFVSTFSYCSIKINVKEAKLELNSQDVIATNLIKEHILRRATDESVKLEITHEVKYSSMDLHHLISCQLKNVKIMREMIKSSNFNLNPEQDKEYEDLIIESLLSEDNFIDIPEGMLPNDDNNDDGAKLIEESFKLDLKQIRGQVNKAKYNEQEKESILSQSTIMTTVYKDIIASYLLEAFIEFDQLQSSKLAQQTKLKRKAKEKITELIELDELKSEANFAEEILLLWKRLKSTL